MRVATVLTAVSAASVVAAHPGLARRQDDTPTVTDGTEVPEPTGTSSAPEVPEETETPEEPAPVDPSPFDGRKLYANPGWSEKLDETIAAFEAAGDEENAARTRTIQNVGTFVWITTRKDLVNIDTAIENARAIQEETGEDHIVGLVSTSSALSPWRSVNHWMARSSTTSPTVTAPPASPPAS